MLIALPIYRASLFQPSWLATTALVFVPGGIASALCPTSAATIQGCVSSTMRGTTAALTGALSHLISLGLGAALIGLASDWLTRLSFFRATEGGNYRVLCGPSMSGRLETICIQSSGQGLRWSLLVLSIFLIWGSLHFLIASRSLRRDLICVTDVSKVD